MPKLSIFLPTIRPHLLEKWYDSLEKSCSYSFEAVFAGPFDIPKSLNRDNVKYIRTFASPTKSAHLAALACDGELIFHCTDDILFLENSIDRAIKLKEELGTDIVNMRYVESAGHSDKSKFPIHYWLLGGSCPIPTLPGNLLSAVHVLHSKELYMNMGGVDCRFDYLTHAYADLMIRAQLLGASYCHSEGNVSTAAWSGNDHAGDHKPIEDAQVNFDLPLFQKIWMTEYQTRRVIDINNHLTFPNVWERRFKGNLPEKYSELIN